MQPPLVFSIPHDHPSLAGHFPHRPIVPGVVILDSAMALILRDRPASTVASLDDVKFLARVSPGSEVAVSFRESAPNRHPVRLCSGRAERPARPCRASPSANDDGTLG